MIIGGFIPRVSDIRAVFTFFTKFALRKMYFLLTEHLFFYDCLVLLLLVEKALNTPLEE